MGQDMFKSSFWGAALGHEVRAMREVRTVCFFQRKAVFQPRQSAKGVLLPNRKHGAEDVQVHPWFRGHERVPTEIKRGFRPQAQHQIPGVANHAGVGGAGGVGGVSLGIVQVVKGGFADAARKHIGVHARMFGDPCPAQVGGELLRKRGFPRTFDPGHHDPAKWSCLQRAHSEG